ncbi:DUF298-domain-containing protein [Hesseltinella vesiculosa]|uniref:Defective in cullin neddylation protein n=1 Tax=Hesseltinella vesiculosa TaxID=101127 RepID=A0A1X2GPY4_9FUNG|nr:DUF298-domain-containing protein [Hesseltinella vesiculosa]
MPPKRKASMTNNKTKKPKTIPKKKSTVAVATHLYEEWFQGYADNDTDLGITPEGMQRFLTDMGANLESIDSILVAWKLSLGRMGYISKQEWMEAMENWNVQSTDQFKSMLPIWQAELANDEVFRQLYLYTFAYAKTTGQKSMDVDIALVLWDLLFETRCAHIPKFVEFIRDVRPVKVINKDQWSSLLDFIKTIPYNLEGYDSTLSWPVLFDDYAHWRKQKDL